MSSQRGNVNRSRQQKYTNKFVYKNDLHDKTKKTAAINKTQLPGLCLRCKEKIEWKIKYGKYKQLTVPKKCVKCDGKTVKQAYYTICIPCGATNKVCYKCGEGKEIVEIEVKAPPSEQAAEYSRLQQEMKFLTERERRTLLRQSGQERRTEDISDEDFTNSEDSESEDLLDDKITASVDERKCSTSDIIEPLAEKLSTKT